jgi:hypothetical protein
MKKSRIIIVLLAAALVFPFVVSCASFRAGMYLLSIDDNNGEIILQNEPNVRAFLQDVLRVPERYALAAYSRNTVAFQFKRTKLLFHSYYTITNVSGEYHTLSFYGTSMTFYSQGAWAMDSDSDRTSYELYIAGDNKWDVKEIRTERAIDTRQTVENILRKMDEGNTYYYKDHVKDLPGVDNCNTALWETLVEGEGLPVLTAIDIANTSEYPGTSNLVKWTASSVTNTNSPKAKISAKAGDHFFTNTNVGADTLATFSVDVP